jgi:hypothetical protein
MFHFINRLFGKSAKATFTLEDFYNWVCTQDPKRWYTYSDPSVCPMGKYLRTRKSWEVEVSPEGLDLLCPGLEWALNSGDDYTYGGLSARVAYLLQAQPHWL